MFLRVPEAELYEVLKKADVVRLFCLEERSQKSSKEKLSGRFSSRKHSTRSPLQPLQAAVVGVVCLVVHDEFVVHEVETVRPGLVRVRHHLANWKKRRGKEGRTDV